MPKKNNTRKRKKRSLIADPKRQAHAQLKGYLYQIWHSVNAWLDLDDDEILYLEGAEDFDKVSGDDATATQVKHTQHNITLRSQEVIDAINNYWELRTKNPDRRVKFRLLTLSKIGKEQGSPFGKDKPGLELWSRCSGDEATITTISEFLQTEEKISEEVKTFLKKAEPQEIYEQLIEPITWETGSPDVSIIEQSIKYKVFCQYKLDSIPIPYHETKKVVESLLKKAWIVATQKENRELTRMHLRKIFYEKANENALNWCFQRLIKQQEQAATLDTTNALYIENSSNITIQSLSPIQTEILPSYRDVYRRTDLLTNIQTKLQSEGIVVIHGGVDKGKTTLAKLTTDDIAGDWFWLNFTNKDPSLTNQHLQQLAFAVSNESAQINVVLDDLNLQPQHLREYDEILSVVIYRVLERGANLLITSQHKSPNNLIRSLDVSKAITVDVPNFTESEIKQFATEMGCPPDDLESWTVLIQATTGGHPRLVHAWFVRLREEGWNEQNLIKNVLQPPDEVVEEREAARQLLANLPENQREFLYRLSLMFIGFSKDYVLNIAEIPEPISYPGDVFSQLVGPWIDQIDDKYYTISPLLSNAANQVWSESKVRDLHAYIANAILKANASDKTKKLTTIETWAVLTHSIAGQNRGSFISVIHALSTAPEDDWENICQEFSGLIRFKPDIPERLFPGDIIVNNSFRLLQYRIAVKVEPEFAPKILEIWDRETKSYEPREAHLLSRLMLATQALKYIQVQLPAKKLVGYLKEIIDIKDRDKELWDKYFNSMGQLKEYIADKSNFFSFLFNFIMVRQYINDIFLDELIDVLDELDPRIRSLFLTELEDYNIDCRIMIENICLQEEKQENPDWIKCLQVYDKVIERSLAWGYPHIAALSARGKAIIHDEYLEDADTSHKVINDFILKVGALLVIEEEQAVIYFHHEHYQEALDIYERILPEWHQSSERFGVGALEEYRRAAICAANLDDWKKAARFFEEGANKTQKIENTERYISLYADAGFAHFKSGNMLNCIKFLYLALRDFETLSQDNTDLQYFTLKKRLDYTIKSIWTIWCGLENNASELTEPSTGFCSNTEINEKILGLPDSPIGYSWLFLAQIEYRFGHETTVFQHALQSTDKNTYPELSFFLSLLKTQYDFRNKTLNELPARIQQLANVCNSIQKHLQSGKGIREAGIGFIPVQNVLNFTSVENIIIFFVSALLMQLSTNRDLHEIPSVWRTNSLELPIKENISIALDLIESMLIGDYNQALTVMKTKNTKAEKQLVASLKVILNKETSLENLFYAHTFIASSLFDHTWLEPVAIDFGKLLSAQWLEKIKTREMSLMNINTVKQIEQACNSSGSGKKKIGHILLAAYPAVSVRVGPEILQQFRTWTESEQKQEHERRKNPTAQRLIKAMEKPPYLTDEDIEALNQSIKEGEIPIKFDSPFDLDEDNDNE